MKKYLKKKQAYSSSSNIDKNINTSLPITSSKNKEQNPSCSENNNNPSENFTIYPKLHDIIEDKFTMKNKIIDQILIKLNEFVSFLLKFQDKLEEEKVILTNCIENKLTKFENNSNNFGRKLEMKYGIILSYQVSKFFDFKQFTHVIDTYIINLDNSLFNQQKVENLLNEISSDDFNNNLSNDLDLDMILIQNDKNENYNKNDKNQNNYDIDLQTPKKSRKKIKKTKRIRKTTEISNVNLNKDKEEDEENTENSNQNNADNALENDTDINKKCINDNDNKQQDYDNGVDSFCISVDKEEEKNIIHLDELDILNDEDKKDKVDILDRNHSNGSNDRQDSKDRNDNKDTNDTIDYKDNKASKDDSLGSLHENGYFSEDF